MSTSLKTFLLLLIFVWFFSFEMLDIDIISNLESDHLIPNTGVHTVLNSLPNTANLTTICDALSVDSILFAEAQFITVNAKALEALMVMARNHKAMSKLLLAIGQLGSLTDPAGTHTATYDQGLTIRTSEILKECGWSLATYKDKSALYGWAQIVANSPWSDSGK